MLSHRKLLIGSSLYAPGIGLAPSALAVCGNTGKIISAGLCTTPQNLVTSNGTVVSGATLSTGTNTAYTASAANALVTNSGVITSTNATETMVLNGAGDSLVNTGTIINTNPQAYAALAVSQTTPVAGIDNSGLISVRR